MSDTCETVTIDTENGPVIINKSDFNEKDHKLHKAKAPAVKSKDKKA